MKKQFIYTVIGVLLLALFTVGVTYSFYAFVISGDKPFNTNSSKFEISYVGGGSIFDGPLNLVTNKEEGYKKTIKINVANGAVQTKLNLYLQIDEIYKELISNKMIDVLDNKIIWIPCFNVYRHFYMFNK